MIEPRKQEQVEMTDGVRLVRKITSSRTLWEVIDDIFGVEEQGMYQKYV